MADTRERYGWTFDHQQAEMIRDALAVGDYAVRGPDGDAVAVVERKTLQDLSSRIADGTLAFVMADLAATPHAAVVVEARYGDLFDVEHVQAGFLAEQLAHLQVRYPAVTVMFAGSRRFAEEWTFRWLGAAARERQSDGGQPAPRTYEPGDIVTLYENRKWKNRAHGNRRATSVHDTQDEALEEGGRLARERGVAHHAT